MKKLIVIFAALISTVSFCQLPQKLTRKEQKAAIEYIRKQLPSHYQKVRMVRVKSAASQVDSMDNKGIQSYSRYYEFKGSICDSNQTWKICLNGVGIKPKTYIYYTTNKIDDVISISVVSGE